MWYLCDFMSDTRTFRGWEARGKLTSEKFLES